MLQATPSALYPHAHLTFAPQCGKQAGPGSLCQAQEQVKVGNAQPSPHGSVPETMTCTEWLTRATFLLRLPAEGRKGLVLPQGCGQARGGGETLSSEF